MNAPNNQHPRGKPVVVGLELKQGDRVVVAKGGKVGLKYDGEETTIGLEGAAATFGTKDGGKRVNLESGRMVCSAAPQKMPFRIETPHAIAEVVGTHFWLGVTEVETTLTVLAGKVALRQKENRLQVSAGETAVADAAGLRRLSPGDAWIRDLLVRAETGPWDVVNLGTGLYSNGVWRMDARGGSAERRIWNMLSGGNDLHQMVIFRDGKRWARGVVVGRMMILPESQAALEVAGAASATSMAWRTYNYRLRGAPAAYQKWQRASVSLTYGPPGKNRAIIVAF